MGIPNDGPKHDGNDGHGGNDGHDEQRTRGDSSVVARLQSGGTTGVLGYPEGIVLDDEVMYVGTPATFQPVGVPPSVVLVYGTRDGELRRRIVIRGEDVSKPHGLSGLAIDKKGRVYVLSTQLGVVRMSPDGTMQEIYAAIPDVPARTSGAGGTTSPTLFDRPPLPNDLAFDPAGNLYVTDSFQAIVWRIPPGGGTARPWLADARFDSALGPNGLRLAPDHKSLYLINTVTGFGPLTAPSAGFIYTVPLMESPTSADVRVFHTYAEGGGPDGMEIGQSGHLYVVLALANQISVLGQDGVEITRFSGPAAPEHPGAAPVPWDAPASIAFDDERQRVLVTNHALITGTPEHFVVFDVYVGERGYPLVRPELP